ncbi:MAG: hypothetical protein JWR85_3036, partial [Marmoricola sp.]|nr:hypothetical protein [Marmoricola sp.]
MTPRRSATTRLCVAAVLSLAAGIAAVTFSAPSVAAGDPVIVVGGDIACPPGKTVDATHCQQVKTGSVLTGA